jgi:hypothetical protein
MKTKIIFTLTFWLIVLSSQSQAFQWFYGHQNYYLHDVSTDQLKAQSQDMIIAGNFFETNFLHPKTELMRMNESSGNIIWQNSYFDQTGTYFDVRVFDVVTYADDNGDDLIAITGSVIADDRNRVFVAKIDAGGNFISAKYYLNVADTGFHSQGLSIIHTAEGPSGRGFAVGGFTNMDYDHFTNDVHRGFVIYIDEESLSPIWDINIFSTLPFSEYDMVSDVTETNGGYFITGSVGTDLNFNLQQAILCMKVDYSGNVLWQNSYVSGNSRDVGVDAYFNPADDEIYLLVNYSVMHYFGVTVLSNTDGFMDPDRIWCALDQNNLDRYGFKIMESVANNETALVIAGYFREGEYIDYNGNPVQSENLPFVYEFDKVSGDEVSLNYFYNVYCQDFGFNDYFDFWNGQMPLIYYPEMAISLRDESGYFITCYTGFLGSPRLEFIKTYSDHKNLCYRTPFSLTHNPRIIFKVDCEFKAAFPEYNEFSLSSIPYDYYTELNCPTNTTVYENADEPNVNVHPNPSYDWLHINISSQESVNYSIYNCKGIKTVVGKLSSGESIIDISTLPPGLYFIKLLINDNYITRKVVIQ